ncbi:MAG: DNA-directed DNA polymerase II small subunit [Candidatus Thermoplasmatota archaeon]|jgi:DNA polymerase II small subunit|uniref:DNA-directed DNA polymerase II small subunit n=1 Tax=Ferroplasma sp. TaxID=2591003 RepID=UPI0017E275CF|nr:DNA-directed DNA polymerase II small subunit [Ferroplasma sp.]MCL4312150.1 DNA-directed DNA polymerase II small subunit [Candidatus Thermoplasmatota archaeon]HII81884.1 DNA-directed DNA polymerase II small subunit [Ferroplasma sp.]
MDLIEDRKRVLVYFQEKGIMVTKTALDLILDSSMGELLPKMVTQEVLDAGYLTENDVLKLIRKPERRKMDFEVYIPDIKAHSSVEDFQEMFTDRYERLKKIIVQSAEMRGTYTIKSAKKTQGKVKIVGMVSEVSTTKNGHKRLLLEDLDDSLIVFLLKGKGMNNELILEDEVLGVVGSISNTGKDPVLFADEVIRPDIPYKMIDEQKKDPVFVASLSDIHVGSKTFRENDFMKMVSWIKSSSEEASQLKYLILSGDVVDGIGVYPGQDKDLEILNPYEQYEKLAEYVNIIPEDVNIFIMPGNHDIVRLAEPQPVFSQKIKNFFNDNVTLLPNPYNLVLENKNVLVYHGMSLNDMIELVPGASYASVGSSIEELLKRRHLAPVYGGKTPIIPSKRDYHVIEQVPDIFITGHIHSFSQGNYRGVRYINASTWQSQTDYQKMMNFSPNPSIMTLFDLNSKTQIIKDFKES